MAGIEKEAESRTLTDNKLLSTSNNLKRIIEIERLAAANLKQKARIKWIMDEDENTSFTMES